MNDYQIRGLEFYQNLGKLFYAVAFADGNIVAEEYTILKKNIETLSFKGIILELDLQDEIISTFSKLYDEKCDAQLCFDDFIDYKSKNNKLFSKSIKKGI